MARYHFGQILLAYVKDGQGHTKEHPVIVIDTDEACTSDDPLQVMVISTRIRIDCPHYHIKVHESYKLNHKTGLYEPCVAKCNWCQEIEYRRIISSMGSLPDDLLDLIIDKVNELLDDEAFIDWVDRD
jgi:mRNA-degrading endonuclease toxin of MazEF toxin-antitoxin module